MAYDLEQEYQQFKENAMSRKLDLDWALIDKTFEYASKDYKKKEIIPEQSYKFNLDVARILLEYSPDTVTIQAALLHGIKEDADGLKEIETKFGKTIAAIVGALTKIEQTPVLSLKQAEAESIRKIIMTLSKDFRIILVHLADRLSNMRTIRYLPQDRQERIAKETLEVYAAIAHKLNLTKIKNELEDLSFAILYPKEFIEIKEAATEKRIANASEMEETRKFLEKELKRKGIDVRVMGRTKHYFSMFKKLRKKEKTFDELMDLTAYRVITKSVSDCYKVLGLLTEMYKPVPNSLDDYISTPKPNMYQSIHINLLDKEKNMEVQIRTEEMHRIAEAGVAAHWMYKGHTVDEGDKKLEWMKSLNELQKEVKEAGGFVEGLKLELFERGIVVFTPTGDMIELPEGATGIDFAFALHTDLGLHLDKVKVNDKIIPISQSLSDGDIVEVLTTNKIKINSNWLHQVKTRKARGHIRSELNLEGLRVKQKARMIEAPVESEGKEKSKLVDGVLQVVQGSTNIKIAGCCNPGPQNKISSFYSKDKYSIHTSDCKDLLSSKDKSLIKAQWVAPKGTHLIRVGIVGADRPTLLADILKAVIPSRLSIEKMKVKTTRDNNALVDFVLRLNTIEEFEALRTAIRKIEGVREVYRTSMG